jgi:hypothetical protein
MNTHYQKRVLQTYHEKRAGNKLSLNLIHSTPAKLRTECMEVFKTRYKKKDEEILKMFFGARDDEAGYTYAIRKFETAKFKPLDNFLKGNTTDPDEKNIELLAWLIDFQPRPFQWNYDYHKEYTTAEVKIGIKEGNNPVLEKEEVTEDEELNAAAIAAVFEEPGEIKEEVRGTVTRIAEPNNDFNKESPAHKGRNILVLLLILAITGGGIYIWKITERPVITGQEKCMFWTGDHYQLVSCNKKMDGAMVYALDSLKTKRFKKITRADTLTNNSLGHVWYSKIDGTVEFYTADGFHPVHTERRLKPMTELILNKYARGNAVLRAGNN